MYFLIGKNNLIKNAALLAHQASAEQLSVSNIRENYLKFISSKQLSNPVFFGKETQWLFLPHETTKYISLFTEKSLLNDLNQENVINLENYNQEEAKEKLLCTENALTRLQSIFPDFKSCFDFFIHTVFSAPSNIAGGGSTSGAIGVIWSNPQKHWSDSDTMELLVHEFTHNMMFIDELCYQHYTNLRFIVDEENFPISAILKKKRPLDKVLHALAVSTEVLSLRHHILGHPIASKAHPESSQLIEQSLQSIHSIKNLKNFNEILTPRAKHIINSCQQIITKIQKDIQGHCHVA